MPCYHPLNAYQEYPGARLVVFGGLKGHTDLPKKDGLITIPCGHCIGCKLEYSRQWMIRLTHENQMHEFSCYLTLTYDDRHLPKNRSLNKDDIVLFIKRLRKRVSDECKKQKVEEIPISYFQCGEYGENKGRPHHHAIIFGIDFPDKKYLYRTERGDILYTSRFLDKVWGLGQSTIGQVTAESCAYVARYVTKKISGESKADHYKGRLPEYATMSRRPAIGLRFLEKYKTDVYGNDTIIIKDKLTGKPPKYYDYVLEKENKALLDKIKSRRRENPQVVCRSRLAGREEYKKLMVKQKLTRKMEKDETLHIKRYESRDL